MATRIVKFDTDNVTPLAGRIFGTIELWVSEAVEERIWQEDERIVGEYLKRKLREAAGTRIVKVGRTVTEQRGPKLVGTFHWSLKGEFYDQLAEWNAAAKRWELK